MSAHAGADAWTHAGTTRAAQSLAPGQSAEVTISTNTTSPIIAMSCGGHVIVTDDANATFDLYYCGTGSGSCVRSNLTTPLDVAADEWGDESATSPGFYQVDLVSGAPATFYLTCNW